VPRVVTPPRPARARPVPAGPAAARAVAGRAVLAAAAAVLAAGCSGGSPGPSQATVATCYGFAVRALDQHVTVTAVPPACRGLNHEQINLAVDRAIRAVAGPHRKAVARRLDHKEAAYLSYLITVVPPRAQPSPAATPSQPSSRVPLDLAALAAWVVTAAAGARLLAGWLAHGGLSRRYTRVAGVPRAVITGHFVLALTGLGIWIVFLVTGLHALAWAAVGVVLAVAGLGMATLAGGLPEGHLAGAATEPPGAGPVSAHSPGVGAPSTGRDGTGLGVAGTGRGDTGGAGGEVASAGPADGATRAGVVPVRTGAIQMAAGQPLPFIALHGVLAAATILLVVLAAIGAG
jgi:hypothetical protein